MRIVTKYGVYTIIQQQIDRPIDMEAERLPTEIPHFTVPKKVGNGSRYLKMLGGTAKTPKRPQAGKPNVMSAHKHHIIGHAGYSPKLRHAMKRQAEQTERKRRKVRMFSSVAEAMAALIKK